MSNAEALVNSGRTRNAVIEAVCALELAINRFAQHPDPAALRKDLPSTPVSFVREREHLGFSTFVRYFMPILFDAAEMGQAIERCARALECRNNIVHNGQRTLDVAQARKHVGSVRMLLSKISSATLAGS